MGLPLQRDIQLIVQTMGPDGALTSRAYGNLPLLNPVLVRFVHAGSAAAGLDMERLAARFVAEVESTAGGKAIAVPSEGAAEALAAPHCHKLLVIVGDDATILPRNAAALKPWLRGDETFTILPVLPLPARPMFGKLMPARRVGLRNAFFWIRRVEEALPALLATASVTAEQPKIFISYRQLDCATLAIQLFDALSHDGFDVFLDHFRIPPGVNFQSRLTQELGDKSMVLVLESRRLQDSKWVLYEINLAKTCGLGVFALNLDDAPPVPGIDEGVRMRLDGSAFVRGKVGGRLAAAALNEARGRIREEHDKALIHRRIHLERSFDRAVRRAGAPAPTRETNGAFRVVTPAKNYLTWLTVRPPDLPDFHYVHGAAHKPTMGVIIGLSRLMEPPQALRNAWLAQLCELKVIDEGRLVWAAGEMARGRL